MLGSGIFVLPGLAAAKTGPSVWLAYLLAAICILPAALSKSELATAMPSSGGTYVYIERAFGPIFGTISGIGLWLSLLLKSSFALVGFGAYMLVLVDMPTGYTKYIAILFLFLIMALNIFGVKKVGRVQIFIVSFSLIGLLLVFIFGIPNIDPNLLEPAFINGNTGLISTIAFVYISYAGVTKVAAIAGEIKNPDRNLPLAMILSLVLITIVYVSIAFVLVGNISVEELATDIKPIYSIAELLGGKTVGYAAGVLGVVTLISMANSGVLASSRFPFAMARDKLLPEFMGKIHPKYLTPVVTIGLTCFFMALVILFLDVEKIAKLASAFKVMMFILVNACVIVLRETGVQWYEPSYKAPLYPFIQLFGIFSGVVLLIFLGWMPAMVLLLISLLGALIFFFYGVKQTDRMGVLKRYGHRPALYLMYKQKNIDLQSIDFYKKENQSSLDAKIASDSSVVVPLLGNEKSAEMLIEIGVALNKKEITQAIHITEVPDQTFLDAVLDDNPTVNSLDRRINGMATSLDVTIDFEAAVTHDLSETIYALTTQTNCDWLVFDWSGRAHNGILVSNPIGWLVTHIDSNFALFKDNGIRHFGKILLALRPREDSFEFINVADRISRFYGASFTLLHVLPEKMTQEEIAAIKHKSQSQISSSNSIGQVEIQQSKNIVESISIASANYDLLIIGTPEQGNWIRVLFGTGKDRIAESSACSVLRLTIKGG